MNNKKPYRDFSDFLAVHFPYKVQKISINAGFTCPNRDGSKGYGGCSYCNNQSFSPGYGKPEKPIPQQLDEGITFFARKYPTMKYLAYFQSYTNTYDNIDALIEKYETALAYPDVVGLVISTRPDCMPDTLLDYLEQLNKTTFVLVEYGVESTLDATLVRVNRLHTFAESRHAIERTAAKGIPVGAHLILGLPEETTEMMLRHADELSKLPLTTVKIHQMQIIKGTVLAKTFRQTPSIFHVSDLDAYIDLCVDFTARLHPDFYIERFASQSPKNLLIAPDWRLKNYELTAKVIKRMHERAIYQGIFYEGKSSGVSF